MLDEERLWVFHRLAFLCADNAEDGSDQRPDGNPKQDQETYADQQCHDARHRADDANPEGADQIGVMGRLPWFMRFALPDITENYANDGRNAGDATCKVQQADDCRAIEFEAARPWRCARSLCRFIHDEASRLGLQS